MDSLTTDRLLLRPFRPDDLDALAGLHAEPAFGRFPLGRGQTRAETETFIARVLDKYETFGFSFHAVVDAASGKLAGWAGLSVPSFLPEVLPAVEVGWRWDRCGGVVGTRRRPARPACGGGSRRSGSTGS